MMEDNRNVPTLLEDGSDRSSSVYGVSEQPCLGEDRLFVLSVVVVLQDA